MRCERCIYDPRQWQICEKCRENPKYANYPRHSYFQEYKPVCPKGYDDCIYDPAYIKYEYPDWYKELYGDLSPEEAVLTKEGCMEKGEYCEYYDDEDK
jgi:hypothetical protein